MPHTIWRSSRATAFISFVLITMLTASCSSKPSESDVTVHARGDDDPLVVQFAGQRFTGNNGTCVWFAYYQFHAEAEYCGVQLSNDEERNFAAVNAKVRAYFMSTAKIPAQPLNWMERQKLIIRDWVTTTGDTDRTEICGKTSDIKQHISQLMLSKRVSDDIIRQLDGKTEPLELSCGN